MKENCQNLKHIEKPAIEYKYPVMMYGWDGDRLLLVFDPDAFKEGYMCIAIEDGYLDLDKLTPQEFIEKNCSGLKYVYSYIKEEDDEDYYDYDEEDEDEYETEDDVEAEAPSNSPDMGTTDPDKGEAFVDVSDDEEDNEYSCFIYRFSDTGKRYIIAQVDENAVKHGKSPFLDYLISGKAVGEFRVKVYSMTPKKEDNSRYDWESLYNEEFCCK